MSQRLTISIAMTTYNGERFLQEQLDSFLQQTRLPDELVVCDDGSQDSTVTIVQSFVSKAPFAVRLFVNKTNLGFSKNFEKAIGLCNGDLIFCSDQDDIWLPEKIETFEKLFYECPEVGCLICDVEMVDENLKPLDIAMWIVRGFTPRLQKQFNQGKNLSVLFRVDFIQGCALAFRGELRHLILPIPPSWGFDYWIGFALSFFGEVRLIPRKLIKYRRHYNQFTSGQYQNGLQYLFFADKLSRFKKGTRDKFEQVLNRWIEARDYLILKNIFRISKINLIDGKIQHLITRASLPDSFSKRLRNIVQEIALGRYQRYSNGWKAALKDLFMGRPFQID